MSSATTKRRAARIAGVVTTIGAVIALATGVAFAYFTDTASSANTFAMGTVNLSVNNAATTTCTFNPIQPGDLAGASCVLAVTYTGTLNAYAALDVHIQSKAGAGGTTLYDGSNTNGITFSVSDSHRSYAVPTGTGTACAAGNTCWTSGDDLAETSAQSTTFASSSTATFTLTPHFPTTVGNAYQGGTATVILTAHAVQKDANSLPAACTSVGQPCAATAGFSWT